ncbi:lactamase [Candidatus Shapirobacteria bacterium CG10_big_fil_rev_8_21_14_0_10_48_15]|uniref:Lactamase n=1 Tax=Candidatus Shapirobacteria bacterium CG10_big_fil_rev_8_21_14_0_10_48_15 TaxID=1974484 RepID=A0A2M8L6J6_9BACT|nr:MAG: lactamase [Candidatus Shapirobacteria bacterium CG10_big_fil_rev_8_21_14_0_10_48_15]
MEIRFLGQACFQIKGKKVTLITDPYDASVGFRLPKVAADIVTVSHQHADHNNAAAVTGTTRRPVPFVITGPGEYEVGGVSVFGFPSFHDSQQGRERGTNTIYVIQMDGLRLVHLGDLGHPVDEKLLEAINGAEILFVPVGGTYTLGPQQAAEEVKKIQPQLTIPMHYQLPGIKLALAPVKDFLAQMGAEAVKPLDKLIVFRDQLPEENETVVLNARN